MQLLGLLPRSSWAVLATVSCWEFVSFVCCIAPALLRVAIFWTFQECAFLWVAAGPCFIFFFWRHSGTAGVQSERTYTPTGTLQLGFAKTLLPRMMFVSKPSLAAGPLELSTTLMLALVSVAPAEQVAAA